jgi:hypothetical protein
MNIVKNETGKESAYQSLTCEAGKNGKDPITTSIKLEQLLMRKLLDPAFLPSHYDIQRAFGSKGYKPNGLYSFCYRNRCEIVNRELISVLSTYFLTRIEKYSDKSKMPLSILEVGAGKGQLGYFLKRSMDRIAPGSCTIAITDSGKDKLETALPVECMDVQEALEKYQPAIVISAWMPYKTDWTKYFRDTTSVKEYVLLGETATCGKKGETWCDHDGFKGIFLEDINKYQICHLDGLDDQEDGISYPHSTTYSFQRLENEQKRE